MRPCAWLVPVVQFHPLCRISYFLSACERDKANFVWTLAAVKARKEFMFQCSEIYAKARRSRAAENAQVTRRESAVFVQCAKEMDQGGVVAWTLMRSGSPTGAGTFIALPRGGAGNPMASTLVPCHFQTSACPSR